MQKTYNKFDAIFDEVMSNISHKSKTHKRKRVPMTGSVISLEDVSYIRESHLLLENALDMTEKDLLKEGISLDAIEKSLSDFIDKVFMYLKKAASASAEVAKVIFRKILENPIVKKIIAKFGLYDKAKLIEDSCISKNDKEKHIRIDIDSAVNQLNETETSISTKNKTLSKAVRLILVGIIGMGILTIGSSCSENGKISSDEIANQIMPKQKTTTVKTQDDFSNGWLIEYKIDGEWHSKTGSDGDPRVFNKVIDELIKQGAYAGTGLCWRDGNGRLWDAHFGDGFKNVTYIGR